MTLEDAGAQTLEFIKTHVTEARQVPLCGNSIGMDRRFLAAYLPEIEEYLHYRSVDVSSVKELVKRWYPGLNNGRPRKAGAHRALDDVLREHRRAEVLPRARVRAARFRRGQAAPMPGAATSRRVRPNPAEGVAGLDPLLVDVVEQRSQSGQLVRCADAVAQRVGIGDRRAGAAGSRVHGREVLAGDRPGQERRTAFRAGGLRVARWCAGRGFCRTVRSSRRARSRCPTTSRRRPGPAAVGPCVGARSRGGARRHAGGRRGCNRGEGGPGGGR